MNERSSRSHTIFTLNIESRLKASEEEDGVVKVAALVSVLIYRLTSGGKGCISPLVFPIEFYISYIQWNPSIPIHMKCGHLC